MKTTAEQYDDNPWYLTPSRQPRLEALSDSEREGALRTLPAAFVIEQGDTRGGTCVLKQTVAVDCGWEMSDDVTWLDGHLCRIAR